MSLFYALAADAVMLLHLAFVGFVVVGGFLLIRYPWLVWLHLPAVAWAILVSAADAVCPLTPLEQWLLARSGQGAYQGGFLSHYLEPLLYPVGLTLPTRWGLAAFVLGINGVAYGRFWRRVRQA